MQLDQPVLRGGVLVNEREQRRQIERFAQVIVGPHFRGAPPGIVRGGDEDDGGVWRGVLPEAVHEARRVALAGKAMVVCMSRRVCVDLYRHLVTLHADGREDSPDSHRTLAPGESTAPAAASDSHETHTPEQPRSRRESLLDRGDLAFVRWHRHRGIPFAEVAEQAATECLRRGWRMLVVDTIGQWAGIQGDAENHSGAAMAAMEPCQDAAGRGLAVWVVRHDRKSGGEVGQSGRGSNAFSGAVDIVLQLVRPEGRARRVPQRARRRLLVGSRPRRTSAHNAERPASRRGVLLSGG